MKFLKTALTLTAIGFILGANLALLTGCNTVNTQDVTKIVVTTTGIKIGKGEVSQTPELTIGRSQVEYLKVPPTTNGSPEFPNVVSRYEVNGHSALFGNVAATSTLAVGTNAVGTELGGKTPPINNATGVNNPPAPPVIGGK